jgi:hypothetical protein
MSMKKLLGDWTRRLSLWVLASASGEGCRRSTGIFYLCFLGGEELGCVGVESVDVRRREGVS